MKDILQMHRDGELNLLGEEVGAYTKGTRIYSKIHNVEGEVQGSFRYEDKLMYTVSLNKENIIDGMFYAQNEDDIMLVAEFQKDEKN